jgi:hypothetical protein
MKHVVRHLTYSVKHNYHTLVVASGYLLMIFAPLPLLAQTPRTFSDVANIFVGYFTALIPILVGLAVALFFWGIVKYLWSAAGDIKAHEEGRKMMAWGVIAIFVMVSIWGIVAILQRAIFDRVLF